ncbi:prepilin-type N-terminal cleavage/methylation domain-containing protein [Psychromonas sp. RZ22]|uniref:type IV pilus modification PilV family protein n=1 Tax=Psychromonas algarum TaxID=2555643 RepID=UPI001067BBB9|nr:prepilin-type N-terminal cleavage/methylation domain-containing protein [Psychromonas sp. RZ22]TEW56678.1 prepilin-type N-terminal cleavage/methylation domain-containing protein [Psychromonas sp. RZ22]
MNRLLGVVNTRHQSTAGFTLIELVIGIVVLALALLSMTTMLISQSKDTLEPIHRLRASQLGQNILQDILSRAYDQNSDHNGGLYRCGEIWGDNNLWYEQSSQTWVSTGTPIAVTCTRAVNYGIDASEIEGEHQNFNDVDDFIENDFVSAVSYGDVLGDVLGDDLSSELQSYAVKIQVTENKKDVFKEILVTIKTPTDEEITFSALKGNY